jgi:SAM-dependent methyltransferase
MPAYTKSELADFNDRQDEMTSPRPDAPPTSAVTDPNAEQMARMIRGYWISQIIGTLAQLGIPDHLAGGPMAADEVARSIVCDPDATYRLLRASKTAGILAATSDGRFGLTPLGEKLRSDVPGSMRDSAIAMTAPGHWLPWGRLSQAVREGRCQTVETLGAELFQYYSDHPVEGSAFTGAMSVSSAQVADEIATLLDTSGAKRVVDVGGASGTLIAALLRKNPLLEGAILERPDVVARARAAVAEKGLASRCHVVAGDFFASVPQADILLLKSIIHDWDDQQSLLILSNCARALRPNGRVVLVEMVVPDDDRPSWAPLTDLNMLAVLPGRERTVGEYRDLLGRAGLRLDRITPTAAQFSVIDASAS